MGFFKSLISDAVDSLKDQIVESVGEATNINLALPCVFDKIKAYADDELLASIGDIQYIINRFGSVVRKEIYDIKNGK